VVVGLVAGPSLADDGARGGLSLGAAALLGVVQGITEFLPISSDGHLALGQALLGIDPASAGHRFTITVHAGTLLAVILTYRRDLVDLARAAMRPGERSESRHLLLAMIVASAPLGLVLLPGVEEFVIATESEIRFVGVALWATAFILWIGFRHDRVHGPKATGRLPTLQQALLIGLAQVTAILPGVSRSGTTISTALLLGIDRAVAARFSFLISIIAVSGAVAKEALAVAMAPAAEVAMAPGPYLVGFLTSFVVGIVALRGLLLLVGRGQVAGFIVYLAIVGGIAVAVG
jgi:undecaprenyl-diphosphatase